MAGVILEKMLEQMIAAGIASGQEPPSMVPPPGMQPKQYQDRVDLQGGQGPMLPSSTLPPPVDPFAGVTLTPEAPIGGSMAPPPQPGLGSSIVPQATPEQTMAAMAAMPGLPTPAPAGVALSGLKAPPKPEVARVSTPGLPAGPAKAPGVDELMALLSTAQGQRTPGPSLVDLLYRRM